MIESGRGVAYAALFTEIGGILKASHFVPAPGVSVNWRKPFRSDLFPVGRRKVLTDPDVH